MFWLCEVVGVALELGPTISTSAVEDDGDVSDMNRSLGFLDGKRLLIRSGPDGNPGDGGGVSGRGDSEKTEAK